MKRSIVLMLTIATLTAAHTVIGSENGIIEGMVDVPSTRHFIEKFNQLVSLSQEKPGAVASQLYTQVFKGYKKELENMFTQAHKTGLMEQCREIMLGTNDNFKNLESFFELLTDPNTLRMMAYMQHTYGQSKANRYYATDKATIDEPIIGTYKPSKSETIQVTSYGFFDAILSTIDSVNKKASPNKPAGKAYTARMKQLDSNLDKAIAAAEMGEDAATMSTMPKIDPKIIDAHALEAEFDAITRKLKDLVKKGNRTIVRELEQIFDTYK